MNTTILALDLGTHTGWALQHLDGAITSGTEHFKPQRFEGGGMRFLRFKRWLNELLSVSNHINAMFFEEVRRHAGVNAAHAYGGFMGYDTLVEIQQLLQNGTTGLDALLAAVNLRVRFDAAQTLTVAEQLQARTNIGAVAAADVGNTDTDFVVIFDGALA